MRISGEKPKEMYYGNEMPYNPPPRKSHKDWIVVLHFKNSPSEDDMEIEFSTLNDANWALNDISNTLGHEIYVDRHGYYNLVNCDEVAYGFVTFL